MKVCGLKQLEGESCNFLDCTAHFSGLDEDLGF